MSGHQFLWGKESRQMLASEKEEVISQTSDWEPQGSVSKFLGIVSFHEKMLKSLSILFHLFFSNKVNKHLIWNWKLEKNIVDYG